MNLGAVGMFGGPAGPEIPVECRRDIFDRWPLRDAVGEPAGTHGMHLLDIAEIALPDNLAGNARRDGGVSLVPHLGDYLVLLRRLGQKARLPNSLSEGFLAIDRDASLHGPQRHASVHMVGDRDGNPMEVLLLLVEHLTEVAVTLGVWILCCGLVQLALIHVTEGVDVLAADATDVVATRHPADSDAADIHLLAWSRLAAAGQDMSRYDGKG